MRVRVKYCGGCNSRYDRKAVTDKLRAAFPHTVFVETDDEAPVDFVAVECGCPSECASHEDLHGRLGKMLIADEGEYERLASAIRQAGGW